MIKKLTDIVAQVEARSEEQNEKFKADLQLMIPVLRGNVKELIDEIELPKYLDDKSDMKTMIEELDEKLEIFKEYEETGMKYNEW